MKNLKLLSLKLGSTLVAHSAYEYIMKKWSLKFNFFPKRPLSLRYTRGAERSTVHTNNPRHR